jgi:hypothetical protein
MSDNDVANALRAVIYGDDMAQADEARCRVTDELSEPLGRLLLGNCLNTPGATLVAIAMLRDTLGYLEGRYARQLGHDKQARADAAAPAPKRQSADKPAAKRGRKPKGNGTPPEPAPSSLPFGPGPALEA